MSSDEEETDATFFTRLELDTSDDESRQDVNIGPIRLNGSVYRHQGPGYAIDVQDQPEKGLSFQVWPSSRTLLRYLDHHQPEEWQGKHVIELGCGCGLVGLCFAACGAHVLLTDLPEPLDLIRSNIELNQCTIDSACGTAIAHELTWGATQSHQLPQRWQSPDVVIAADVVYRQELFQPLLSALEMLGGTDTVILLAHVRRWKSDKRFFKALGKAFSVSDITSTIDKDADLLSSNTKGALRLFELRRHKTVSFSV